MGRDRGRSRARVIAPCAWCGRVDFDLPALQVHDRSPDDGLIEYECPDCGRLILRRVIPDEAATLLAAGATPGDGLAPLELLEEHGGDPIGWDDLLEFHEAMARSVGDPGASIDAPVREPARERDAA